MNAIAITTDLIKRFEGCHRLKEGLIYPYLDPVGMPTQGWGVVVKGMDVPAITQEEADETLEALIPVYQAQTLKLCPGLVRYPKRLAAITDFVFNLGPGRLRGSTLRRRINDEDWEAARSEIVKWNKAGGKPLRGLTRRREAEAALL